MKNLHFYVNGKPFHVQNPDPRTLLVDFLRSSEVGLTGTKKSCAQGGCGACTVMLSYYKRETKKVYFESINSCLRPICSLDGMEITTTEGVGSVNTSVSCVQYEIAKNNGSQCGFCTPGWVMNMHAHLVANGDKGFTKKEIEALFDGNICRCTGYRPILYAFKHFASDWDPVKDNEGVVQCIVDPEENPEVKDHPVTFPDQLKTDYQPVVFEKNGYHWTRVLSLKDLSLILKEGLGPDDLKLVVGNTSYGIYNPYPLDAADYYNPHHFVDISKLEELQYFEINDSSISFGAATTYTQLLNQLAPLLTEYEGGKKQTVDTLHYMVHRTAGTIVRNAASVGGNTMIAIHHITKGSPFPSDLLTAMAGLNANVTVYSTVWDEKRTMPILEFANAYNEDKALYRHSVLLGYEIPFALDNTFARTYKVALRKENSHSIVNACITLEIEDNNIIADANIVFGGIAPIAMHASNTEESLCGEKLDMPTLQKALHELRKEIEVWIGIFEERLENVPNEGFTDDYRIHLTETYLYQHFIYTLAQINPDAVPANISSEAYRIPRPVSTGKQKYEKYESEYPVNEPMVKLEAFMQASGEAIYNQDKEISRSGLIGAWVNSAKSLATISYQYLDDNGNILACSIDELNDHLHRKFPEFFDYVTSRDIPNQDAIYQGSGNDDPIMVVDEVTSYGQSIGIILANEVELAEEIAYYVANSCIHYDTETPLISLTEAIAEGDLFQDCPNGSTFPTHIWKITRDGTSLDWTDQNAQIEPKDQVVTTCGEVDGVDCLIIHGTQEIGGQIHFYMGPQAIVAVPGEHDNLTLYPDTQSPDSVQSAVMKTLNLQANDIDIKVKRVAGGYGGKTTRSPFVAAPVAVAAWKHRRPVKMVMRRENDTAMVGHRHPTLTKFQIAIGTGKDDIKNEGKIMGLKIDWWFNGGNTYDCSFTVMDCMQLRSSSGYYIPNYQSSGDVAQTNISSNTAFRAFGMLQGILGLEDGIEAAAWQLGIRPEDIRGRNLYKDQQKTPYGQPLNYLYIDKVWEYTKDQTDFKNRLSKVEEFNKNNRWKKRGISMIPILYGSGYNAVFLEQGGALIEVYDQDGTVIVRQGGVDMGQGLNTKVTQITAEALNIPVSFIKIGETDIRVVPNPISTGASTGSAYNGAAAKEAGQKLRKRLEDYCFDLLKLHGQEWCEDKGVNFWDHPEGWKAPYKDSNMWASIVGKAYKDRVNLSQQVRFRQGGGEGIDTGLSYHDGSCKETVNYFVGFTYSAACSEVEVDILTGVTTVLRSDIIYDVGKSLNPAIDIGQIEGGFIQGVGYVLTEALIYEEKGDEKGRLNTLNTWRYKPPAHTSIPIEMNVDLFPRSEAKVTPDPNLLMGAKEVGEPPLVLGATVYFAVKHAVLDARKDKGIKDWFRMDAPLTPQQVREHALVDPEDMIL
jgi:xanthine dehydrogenase/oxidase